MQLVNTLTNGISNGTYPWEGLISQIPVDWLFLAQSVEDPDVLGQMQDAWNNFVSSGQIWALLLGLIIGYMFRGFTSF
ncbi:MAG: hypothetical protein WA919_15400 [Coleofasciculaceae cyanobacterium]